MKAAFASCAVVALAAHAQAAVLAVPGVFPTIQAAENAAVPGDVIQVAPGVYAPFVVDVDDLTIEGMGPGVIVDGLGAMRCAAVDATGMTIMNIAFANGNAGSGFDGGCLYIADLGEVSVVNSSFTNCRAPFGVGGGVYVGVDSTLVAMGSHFQSCSAEWGGAIGNLGDIELVSAIMVSKCDFFDNIAEQSGGAIDAFMANVELTDSCFYRNKTQPRGFGSGGAISNAFSTIAAQNCVFWNNTAVFGGAAWFTIDGSNYVCFSTFCDNLAKSGGAFDQDASPSIGSDPYANSNIGNSIFVNSRMVNNQPASTTIDVSFTFYDRAFDPGVADVEANLGLADLPPGVTDVKAHLFVDPALGDFHLRYECVEETPGVPCVPDYAIVIDAGSCEICADVEADKDGNCRAVDVIDNTATGDVDEGVPNNGLACALRNCTFEAPDMGAFEYQQLPVPPIVVPCEGDVNGDGQRNVADFIILLQHFGTPCP